MTKTKILILITVFLDVIGLGIIIPILPFYVQRFSSSPLLITSLFAVYATCSFFSAPVIGAFSDKIGRKKMLIASIFSTSLGWFIFALAPNVLFLFLGRIIDGAAAGNLPIAQAYLTDIARDERERTTNLGLIGGVFGIGFIVGPFLGGALASISHSFPFWLVGIVALVNGILAIFFLPETHHSPTDARSVSMNPFVPIVRAIKDKVLLPNYAAWLLFSIAVAGFHSVFSLYSQKTFGLNEFTIGFLFAGMGFIIALNQTVVLRHVWLRYFKEPRLELIMLLLGALGFVLMSMASFPIFVLGLMGLTFGQSILRVVMNSQMASRTDPRRKGEVFGITSSLMSLGMALGPFVVGHLFALNPRTPFFIGAVLLAISFVILYWNRNRLPKDLLPIEESVISQI